MAEGDPVSEQQCQNKEKEFRESLTRVHIRVDGVEKTTIQIEASAKTIERSVTAMHALIFGNEKADGLVTKVSNLNQKVGGLYWFGSVVIIALVGTLVSLLFRKG